MAEQMETTGGEDTGKTKVLKTIHANRQLCLGLGKNFTWHLFQELKVIPRRYEVLS